ncbi:hypothetical protein B7463_g5235, partial [Scytalidium lignicola]
MSIQPSATKLDELDKKGDDVNHISEVASVANDEVAKVAPTPVVKVNSYLDDEHINLGWRSWMAVFVTCFANGAQVFVVTAAGSVIAFIVRDLGDAPLSGWIVQGPLLMQSVLSPIVGRLSDVLDRKYIASLTPLVAFAGAVISARATSMKMLIGGGILIGTNLSTVAIVHSIPSEILPMKYRALANGFGYVAGAIGGLVGTLGSGGVTNADAGGWRTIFWMQAAFYLASSIGLLLFYWPQRRSDYPKMSLWGYVWSCDPIGSLLFAGGTCLLLLAFDWSGGAYHWSDPHVAVNLGVGGALLIAFGLYEWKGRDDGLVAHVLFRGSPNFALSVFTFSVEGWMFYSAVNSVTPQVVLNLGFESTSWEISKRQLYYNVPALLASLPIIWYATRYKDLKTPLLITLVIFLVVVICYACIQPWMSHAQIGFNIICGIGQSGPLSLLVALVQFTAPHAYLSTATGLAFSARAIGGAFGSAVLSAIINGKLSSTYAPTISKLAISAGLPISSAPAFAAALKAGKPTTAIPGVTPEILALAVDKSHHLYAQAYRLAFSSIIPFVILAFVASCFLKGVKELMTEHVEATVEKIPDSKEAV